MQSGSDLEGAESILLFADETDVHDLAFWLKPALEFCPATKNYKKNRAIGYRLFDIRWEGEYRRDGSSSRRTYVVKSRLELFCQDPEDRGYPVRFDVDHELILHLPVNFQMVTKGEDSQHQWQLQKQLVQAKIKPM